MDAVWLRPQEAMTNLPFIGRLNTVFVVAVAIGMGIILLCMILNIINSLRSHDVEKAYFDTNGVAAEGASLSEEYAGRIKHAWSSNKRI